jgi:hypothetical protein
MKQGLIIDEKGYKEWYLNGKVHREGGPAIEWVDGSKEWYLKGELHRVVGPAVEYSDGGKEWCLNGEKHRVEGPACEYSNGTKEWFLNGRLVYSKNVNNLHKYPNLSKPFKQSIVKYRLTL